MTLEQIDQQVHQEQEINKLIETFWDDYQKKLKENKKAFAGEITEQFPEWVKERRVEFLQNKVEKLNQEYITRFNEMQQMRKKATGTENWLWNLMADIIKKEYSKDKKKKRYLPDIARDIKRTKFEIDCWHRPEIFSRSDSITPEEINMAREESCEHFIEVKKTVSDKKLALCPYHEDRHPSLVIYPRGRGFHCFACGAHGDTIELVRKVYNLDFPSAVKAIIGGGGNNNYS